MPSGGGTLYCGNSEGGGILTWDDWRLDRGGDARKSALDSMFGSEEAALVWKATRKVSRFPRPSPVLIVFPLVFPDSKDPFRCFSTLLDGRHYGPQRYHDKHTC